MLTIEFISKPMHLCTTKNMQWCLHASDVISWIGSVLYIGYPLHVFGNTICVQLLKMKPRENWPHETLSVVVFNADNGFFRGQPGICRNITGRAQKFVWCYVQILLHDFFHRPAWPLTDEFLDLSFDYIDSSVVLFSRVFVNDFQHTLKQSFQLDFFTFLVVFWQFNDYRKIHLDCIEFVQFSFQEFFDSLFFRFSQKPTKHRFALPREAIYLRWSLLLQGRSDDDRFCSCRLCKRRRLSSVSVEAVDGTWCIRPHREHTPCNNFYRLPEVVLWNSNCILRISPSNIHRFPFCRIFVWLPLRVEIKSSHCARFI